MSGTHNTKYTKMKSLTYARPALVAQKYYDAKRKKRTTHNLSFDVKIRVTKSGQYFCCHSRCGKGKEMLAAVGAGDGSAISWSTDCIIFYRCCVVNPPSSRQFA